MLCGWCTHSEILLTGVPTLVNHAGNVDVTIEVATGQSPLSTTSGRFVFQHSAEYSLLRIGDIADFEITRGRKIRVWATAAAAQKDIEIFLLGPAWATLCHQRGTLPLHASAIVTRTGIAAFAGHSGAGKSTTAALLRDRSEDSRRKRSAPLPCASGNQLLHFFDGTRGASATVNAPTPANGIFDFSTKPLSLIFYLGFVHQTTRLR